MTLHQFIKDYRNNEASLNDMISFVPYNERNAGGKIDQITKIKFNDGKLNFLLANLKSKFGWLDASDIEAWFVEGLEDILEKADPDSYSPAQLHSYVRTKINGYILNQIDRMEIHETMDEIIDQDQSLSEWQELEYDSPYSKFLESTGGLKKLLSSTQYNIYLSLQTSTQNETGDSFGVSQQSISKTMTAAMNRVRTSYLQHQTFRAITADTDSIYDKITRFEQQYLAIVENDTENSFDYFNYTLSFLRDNLGKGDTAVDFVMLQKNRTVSTPTVIDILVDNLRNSDHYLFKKVLQGKVYRDESINLSSREKDKFVMATLRSFKLYEKQVEESVREISKTIVNKANPENYPEIAKSLTQNDAIF